jgi:hypothetical protein
MAGLKGKAQWRLAHAGGRPTLGRIQAGVKSPAVSVFWGDSVQNYTVRNRMLVLPKRLLRTGDYGIAIYLGIFMRLVIDCSRLLREK